MPATRPYLPHILLAFDFDSTLGSDSIDAILEVYETGRTEYERDFVEPLGENWDAIIKRGQALAELGRAKGRPLSREVMGEAAGRVSLFQDVLEMPKRLAAVAREIHRDCELRFVVLSSGYAEIINATPVAGVFDRVLASSFHYGPNGEAICLKRVVSHPEKVLYLQAIAKDVGIEGANAPQAAGRDVDEYERYVPFDQMIYVGDGASDLLAFGFMKESGGLAVAIDKDHDFDLADQQRRKERVDDLAPPDYRPGGELMESLQHAVRACASRIALRSLGRGE